MAPLGPPKAMKMQPATRAGRERRERVPDRIFDRAGSGSRSRPVALPGLTIDEAVHELPSLGTGPLPITLVI